MLATLRHITPTCKTTFRERRKLVNTYGLSIVEYLLYLQPMTTTIKDKAVILEHQCLTYILATRILQHQLKRASPLASLAPLRTCRHCHLISAVSKFYFRAISSNVNQRDITNWQNINDYSTIVPFIRSCHLPDECDEMTYWTKAQIEKTMNETCDDANNFIQKIPGGQSISPVFRRRIGHHPEKKAVY